MPKHRNLVWARHFYLVFLKHVHVDKCRLQEEVISLSAQVTGTFCLAPNRRDNPSLYLGENGRRITGRDGGLFALQFRAVACLVLSWETCYPPSPGHHQIKTDAGLTSITLRNIEQISMYIPSKTSYLCSTTWYKDYFDLKWVSQAPKSRQTGAVNIFPSFWKNLTASCQVNSTYLM